jgi:ribosomal protein S18 acetylase RimI-like enzyme
VDVRSIGFRTDLMIRRLAGSTITDRGPYLCTHTPANPWFWWGNFLLVAEPPRVGGDTRWDEVFAAEFPDAAHVAIGVDNVDGDTGDAAALSAMGLSAEAATVLTAGKLADPRPLGAGVTMRPLRDERDWTQAYALRLACEDEAPSPSHEQFLRQRQDEAARMTSAGCGSWFGAFVDGQMRAGLGLFSDRAGFARFQSVDTHPDYRRQGLARALLSTASQWGATNLESPTFVIVADTDYFAIDLYRDLGFADTEQQVQLHREPPAEEA